MKTAPMATKPGAFEPPIAADFPAPAEPPDLTEIVAIDGDTLPDNRLNLNRALIPKLPRTFGEAMSPFSSTGSGPGDRGLAMPVARTKLPRSRDGVLPATPDTSLVPGGKGVGMGSLLDIKVFKYPDTFGGGYFRIDISTNKKAIAALPPFQKDVVFLLDVSGSIRRRRLAQFKSGVLAAVKNLRKGDRFNVVAFQSGNIPFANGLVRPNAKILKALDDFLFTLRSEGTTNVYPAIAPYVGSKNRAGLRPLIVFLASDGKVNYGELTRNREILNAVSNGNHAGASVYCFSVGDDRNSFLMDLLAYRNRGESCHVRDVPGSGRVLATFANQVSDVSVADIDYQVSSNLTENTFPKRLPNIYRGRTLSIYGRYEDKNTGVGLRVTGRDSAGVEREAVFGGRIANATVGDENIKREWARQYLYHLYSILSVKYDKRLVEKIHDVASEYKLKLPYLDKHLKDRRKNYVE